MYLFTSNMPQNDKIFKRLKMQSLWPVARKITTRQQEGSRLNLIKSQMTKLEIKIELFYFELSVQFHIKPNY